MKKPKSFRAPHGLTPPTIAAIYVLQYIPHNHELGYDLRNWFLHGAQLTEEGDLLQALFAVSVIAAILSQKLRGVPPSARVTEDELERRDVAFDRKVVLWRSALRDLLFR